ncbi:sulfite exporter TauE/SafE family protein, partial [Streptomyces fradiae]
TPGVEGGGVGPFVPAAVLGARDGRRLADRVSGAALRRVFAFALLAVAAYMLADALL